MLKVLFDTDIGSDIDDAVALAFLLGRPDCQLIGITTVSGKPVERAAIASAICRAAGRDVPILPGIEQPLAGPQRQPEVPQAAVLKDWPHERSFLKGEAIPFMRRVIRENPGEVVLLPVGPLTNIAALFAADEEIPRLLKGLVLMGGVFAPRTGAPRAEWNIRCDPVAASVVYRSPAPMHRSVGLDVTLDVTMARDEVLKRFTGPVLKPVVDFAEVWFRHGHRLVFHDPLAAVSVFDESVCTFTRGRVEVELASERLAGTTFWTPQADGPHEIATAVDPGRFFDTYFAAAAK